MRDCEHCKHHKNGGCESWDCEFEPTTKNDLGVDWESYKDADGNSLDYLILNVLQNSFDGGDAYGYTVADKIIGLLPSVTPLSSELEKNSKKLEKDFGELDCISRADVLQILLDYDYANENALVLKDIKALPPVTPQLCEDAISRQALLNATVHKNSIWNKITDSEGNNLETIISKLPSVTPIRFVDANKMQEPRKGHWIKGYTFPDGEYWKCDKCNELIKVKYPMYYCNNCGSDNSREVEE